MEIKSLKVVVVVLVVLLAGSIGVLSMQNLDISKDLNDVQEDLSDTQSELNDTISELNDTISFIDTYLKATVLCSLADTDSVNRSDNESIAGESYDKNKWNDAINHYEIAMECGNASIQKTREARTLFKKAKNLTDDDKYQELCSLYIDITDSGEKYEHLAIDYNGYMRSACIYYKNGNWEAGDNELSKANVKVDELWEEYDIYYDLIDQLYAMLKNWEIGSS